MVVDALSRDNAGDARRVIEALTRGGIDLRDVNRTLEDDGIRKFATSSEKTLGAIAARRDPVRR